MNTISVVALKAVTLYEDADDFVLYASQDDVKKGKHFDVPDTDFWQHKIKEKVLASAGRAPSKTASEKGKGADK